MRPAKKAKEKKETAVECQWFLNCTREAVTTVEHPVLGHVPVCSRCHDFATQ